MREHHLETALSIKLLKMKRYKDIVVDPIGMPSKQIHASFTEIVFSKKVSVKVIKKN